MAALKILKTLALCSALFFLPASLAMSEPGTLDTAAINQLPIKNLANPQQAIFTAAQPNQQELAALAVAGIRHVINLRPVQEQQQALDWNEAELVASLNMQYHSIPVAGAAGVNLENATTLAELIKSLEGEPVFLHCASSNRVGALKALYDGSINKANTDDAITTGKLWGLSSLEPVVQAQLGKPQ